jgi:predicted RNase H-like nuclease
MLKKRSRDMTEQEIARAIVQAVELNKTISYVDNWGKKRQIKLVDLFDYVAKTSKEITLETFAKKLKSKWLTGLYNIDCVSVGVIKQDIDETLKEMGVEE